MPRLVISEQAEADLLDLWLYIAADSPAAADHLISTVHEKCLLLAGMPEMGRKRDELCEGIRSFPVGSHLVFYRARGDTMEVARVLGGSRDLPALFES